MGDGTVARGVLGGLALACQVFAGHLQDALFTIVLVGAVWTLSRGHRAQLARSVRVRWGWPRFWSSLGVLVSAVQWVPSKELLDRSPRAGGLSWEELIYGSWHPELLPTLVVREAYGTRARDTDWMDGFYPYHEMNAYMGLIAMALAVVGAGGPSARDRWSSFWVILVGVGAILMLGKFTFLFDFAHRIPVLGSSREPVRFHLWVALGVAALAAVGVERLGRPGAVSLRGGLMLAALLIVLSIPIMIYIYHPVWTQPNEWPSAYHQEKYRWLGRELILATARTTILAAVSWLVVALDRANAERRSPRKTGGSLAASRHGRPLRFPLGRRPYGRSSVLDTAPRVGPVFESRPRGDSYFWERGQIRRRAGIRIGIHRLRRGSRHAGLEPAGCLAPRVLEGRNADDLPSPPRLL